jgi:hypothetical protein
MVLNTFVRQLDIIHQSTKSMDRKPSEDRPPGENEHRKNEQRETQYHHLSPSPGSQGMEMRQVEPEKR